MITEILFFPKTEIIVPDKTTNFLDFITMSYKYPKIIGSTILFGAFKLSIFNLFPVFIVRLSYHESFATFLLMVGTIGVIITQIPLGKLLDKFNNNLILKYASLVCVILPLCYFIPDLNQPSMILLTFLYCSAFASLFTIGLVLIGKSYRNIAKLNIAYGGNMGIRGLIIPIIAGYFIDLTKFPISLMLTLSMASLFYFIILIKNPK